MREAVSSVSKPHDRNSRTIDSTGPGSTPAALATPVVTRAPAPIAIATFGQRGRVPYTVRARSEIDAVDGGDAAAVVSAANALSDLRRVGEKLVRNQDGPGNPI